jgi:serine/threonine protein kinase
VIGETVGSYRILSLIAEGGMGTVYRAEHALIGRLAAVKVLHPVLTTNRDIVNRFFNEAKATTTIKHPGIVEVFDFGYLPSGLAYLVMEFLEGMTLAERMKARGPLHEGEAAMLLRGVCSALAAAHARGIVHRDLKPDNIFLVPDPESPLGQRSKLLDFGIAKLTDVGPAGSVTKTGAVMGTPTYMSPEQCRGTGAVDHRADLYSIGCMFYELLTGRPPFVNAGAGELIGSHLFVQPEPPSRYVQGISPETEALIMSLLDKQPERRIQTSRELASVLSQIAHRFGWAASMTDVDARMSAPYIATPGDQTYPALTPASFTPSAPMFTPAHHTPMPSQPVRTPTTTTSSTTLSGAASQSAPSSAPRRTRSRWVIGAVAGLAITGGIIAFVAVGSSSGGTGERTAPSAAGAPTKPADTKPADIKPADIKPADTTSTKPADTKPADIKPTKPVDTKPAEIKLTNPVDTKPADSKPTKPADTKPADIKPTKPVDTKPADTKPTKPVDTKPADIKPAKPVVKPTKPARPKKPTRPGDDPNLLETDL